VAEPSTTELTTYCYRHPRVATGVSCSDCGRPICTDCMSFGPVGIRCPECSGTPTGVKKKVRRVQERGTERASSGVVTKALIGINAVVFVLQAISGGNLTATSGRVFEEGALYGPLVADGEWWRLISSAFLHGGLIHLAFNMLFLWWFGRSLEAVVGSARFIAIYLVSALAGAAGALLISPTTPTVGASGAVFGILGAGLVLERSRVYVFGGQALFVIGINLVLSFVLSNISIGGHVGGLIGGALAMLALMHFGRNQPLFSREGAAALVALVAIGLASVLIAYARVRGLA
jgi:membrane associated rhomboid family serine protease